MSYDDTLDALAHELRRQILSLLRECPRSVGELAEALPVSQPAISQHLKVLREARLVSMEPAGTRHIYHLEPRGFQELRDYLASFWDGPLEAYKATFAHQPKHRRASRTRGRGSPEDERKRR
jgi:DNA-binding transcriptional ArsR family regulator